MTQRQEISSRGSLHPTLRYSDGECVCMSMSDVVLEKPGIEDADEIEAFCRQVFPAVYDRSWYPYMLTAPEIFKLCFRLDGKIIGIIVGRADKRQTFHSFVTGFRLRDLKTEMEELDSSIVAYIMLLGVKQNFRGRRLGSRLLNAFLEFLENSFPFQSCSVYLHVASENTAAIEMYRKRGFQRLLFLHSYYNYANDSEPEDLHDAFLYAKHFYATAYLTRVLRMTPSFILTLLSRAISICFSPVDLVLYYGKKLFPRFSVMMSSEPAKIV